MGKTLYSNETAKELSVRGSTGSAVLILSDICGSSSFDISLSRLEDMFGGGSISVWDTVEPPNVSRQTLTADPESVIYNHENGVTYAFCEREGTMGTRRLLKKALAYSAVKGKKIKIGAEISFSVHKHNPASDMRTDEELCELIRRALIESLNASGMDILDAYRERGSGRNVFSFEPCEPLNLADKLVYFIHIAKRTAWQEGAEVEFDQSGAARFPSFSIQLCPGSIGGSDKEGESEFFANIASRFCESAALFANDEKSYTRLYCPEWSSFYTQDGSAWINIFGFSFCIYTVFAALLYLGVSRRSSSADADNAETKAFLPSFPPHYENAKQLCRESKILAKHFPAGLLNNFVK